MFLLFKALEILASPTEIQINYLVELGTAPSTDELALQFDDSYKMFLGAMNEKKEYPYDKNVLKALEEINSFFDEMSDKNNNDKFWYTDLLDGIEWTKVRELTKDTLRVCLGIEKNGDRTIFAVTKR